MEPDDSVAAATLEVINRLADGTYDEIAETATTFGRGTTDDASAGDAESAARSIVAAIGCALSEGEVRSPQGRSSGMFSRRLAHVRVDLTTLRLEDSAAAVICHEIAHCLDPGPYDFDHPWQVTPEQRRQAVAAQLVACLSSHAFVHSALEADPGPTQLAIAAQMVRAIGDGASSDPAPAYDAAGRVAAVTAVMRVALEAPRWTKAATREVAVDRGRGVMWLAVGPAAWEQDPPSPPAEIASRLSREAQRRFADDPRFTTDLDRWRPIPRGL